MGLTRRTGSGFFRLPHARRLQAEIEQAIEEDRQQANDAVTRPEVERPDPESKTTTGSAVANTNVWSEGIKAAIEGFEAAGGNLADVLRGLPAAREAEGPPVAAPATWEPHSILLTEQPHVWFTPAQERDDADRVVEVVYYLQPGSYGKHHVVSTYRRAGTLQFTGPSATGVRPADTSLTAFELLTNRALHSNFGDQFVDGWHAAKSLMLHQIASILRDLPPPPSILAATADTILPKTPRLGSTLRMNPGDTDRIVTGVSSDARPILRLTATSSTEVLSVRGLKIESWVTAYGTPLVPQSFEEYLQARPTHARESVARPSAPPSMPQGPPRISSPARLPDALDFPRVDPRNPSVSDPRGSEGGPRRQ